MSLKGFSDTAKGLAKNPIGVVALFLVLIYGFAALLLGLSANTLSEAQRWPFVWFLVLFPAVLLGTFTYLVVHHHEKLYAPSEYRDERHFFKKLDPAVQRARFEETVSQLVASQEDEGHAEEEQYRSLDKDEVRLNVTIAEDLAIRALEQRLKTTISREVAVRAGESWLNLDGAVARGDELVAIEVKHVRAGRIAMFQIEHLLDLLSTLKFERFRSVTLALVVVSEDSREEDTKLRKRLEDVIQSYAVSVDLHFLKLDQLKKQFGLGT